VTDGGPVLVDTHIFLWYLEDSPRLEPSTVALLDGVTRRDEPILLSAVSVVELAYLVDKGTLAEEQVDAVHAVLDAPGTGFEVVPLDEAIGWAVGRIPRAGVADPWDRMIAATALARAVPLVTYDGKLQALADLPTIR
jgi:PIN domain nuclease of toxin-antitoxin system